jgi:hypothetical protein
MKPHETCFLSRNFKLLPSTSVGQLESQASPDRRRVRSWRKAVALLWSCSPSGQFDPLEGFGQSAQMCNLYNMVTNAQAMIELGFLWEKVDRNFPPLYGIYPDYFAPIISGAAEGKRRIGLARWGLPYLKDAPTEKPNRGTTNIRHPWYEDWKGYLGVEHRRLVPFNRFSEPMKTCGWCERQRVVCVRRGSATEFLRRPHDVMARHEAQR